MTRRTSIITAISEKFKENLNGIAYPSNVYGNAYPTLKFWDEVNDFPCIYMSPGTEIRQYELSAFAWGIMNVSIKVYTRGEDAQMKVSVVPGCCLQISSCRNVRLWYPAALNSEKPTI